MYITLYFIHNHAGLSGLPADLGEFKIEPEPQIISLAYSPMHHPRLVEYIRSISLSLYSVADIDGLAAK